MSIAAQQQAEIVEPGDDALQLHAIDEENRQRDLGLANMVEEGVLEVVALFGHLLSAPSLSEFADRLPVLRCTVTPRAVNLSSSHHAPCAVPTPPSRQRR